MKTEQELKLSLVKLLPERIEYRVGGDCELPDDTLFIFWKEGIQILDTEMLHVCRLIEQKIDRLEYWDALYNVCDKLDSLTRRVHMRMFSASWQQRAAAILKVKGIE